MTSIEPYRFASRHAWETSGEYGDPDRQWVTRAHACERMGFVSSQLEPILESRMVHVALIFEMTVLWEVMVCLNDLLSYRLRKFQP